jgi:general secretion pathway protein D
MAALVAGACASERALSRAERAARMGDWDTAVAYYTRAAQAEPSRAEYKVALKRALENAAMAHLEKGRVFEARGQLDDALREYRRASEYDPLSGELAAKVQEMNRKIAERIEAARPKPRIEQLREQARQMSPEPTLDPASRQPLDIVFNNAAVRAILDFIGKTTGINITYDRDTQRQVEQNYSVELHGVTLEQALNQIMTANVLFYKVLDPHTILVITDTAVKRQFYDEQVIQTFYISHADASELLAVLNQVIRVPGVTSVPSLQVNKTANTITIRSTAAVAKIIEQVIASNDKPRAELVLDVEVLEVNRARAKQYGLDLNDYSANLVFSPEAAPGTGTSGTGTTTTATGVTHTNLFNLNSLNGLHKGDFYLSIPAAIIRLLESDTDTRLVAKPQLRGSEGEKLMLNLGSEIPVPSTTFGAYAGGGMNAIPISSFNMRNVGLNVEITPRVTFDGDVILTLSLENSTYLGTISMAGQDLPSFGTRRVTTRLRLRDGETNLLAGLLQTNDSRTVTGFPGLLRVPILKQIFASNKTQTTQTDIIMLLTPHVIRSHELTERDVSPIYIGTPSNLGISGPPPLIAAPPSAAGGEQPPGSAQVTPPAGTPPGAPPGAPPTAQAPAVPPKVSPTPGAVSPPPAGTPPPAGIPPAGGTPPAGAQPPAGTPPAAAAATPPAAPAQPTVQPPAAGGALVAVSVSGSEFRVGGGTYTVPIMINGATGISTLSITVRYNPAVLRVRSVQEGSFMRQGGLNSGFAQQVDATGGRLDITFTRAGDVTGASGGGLLGAILVDPVAAGSTTLSISGVAAGPTGTPVPLQFAPATITVR